MNVEWRTESPPTNKYGMSELLVVKTNLGYVNTAYWSKKLGMWELCGMISNREYVVAWLQGLKV